MLMRSSLTMGTAEPRWDRVWEIWLKEQRCLTHFTTGYTVLIYSLSHTYIPLPLYSVWSSDFGHLKCRDALSTRGMTRSLDHGDGMKNAATPKIVVNHVSI